MSKSEYQVLTNMLYLKSSDIDQSIQYMKMWIGELGKGLNANNTLGNVRKLHRSQKMQNCRPKEWENAKSAKICVWKVSAASIVYEKPIK